MTVVQSLRKQGRSVLDFLIDSVRAFAVGAQPPVLVAALVLHAIYERDFLGFSYGFRPGRSQQQALDALAVAVRRKRVNWLLDADIRGFFAAIDHPWLERFVEHRVADPRMRRLIAKWLKAGVLDNGK